MTDDSIMDTTAHDLPAGWGWHPLLREEGGFGLYPPGCEEQDSGVADASEDGCWYVHPLIGCAPATGTATARDGETLLDAAKREAVEALRKARKIAPPAGAYALPAGWTKAGKDLEAARARVAELEAMLAAPPVGSVAWALAKVDKLHRTHKQQGEEMREGAPKWFSIGASEAYEESASLVRDALMLPAPASGTELGYLMFCADEGMPEGPDSLLAWNNASASYRAELNATALAFYERCALAAPPVAIATMAARVAEIRKELAR